VVKPAIVVCSRRVKTSASVPCIDSFRARKSQEPQRRSKIRKLERSPGDAIVFQKGAVTGPLLFCAELEGKYPCDHLGLKRLGALKERTNIAAHPSTGKAG